MAPYGAGEVVQSTVRSSEATLKGILKVFLKVFLKGQSSKAQPICVFTGSAEQSLVELCFRRLSRAKHGIYCVHWLSRAGFSKSLRF